MRTCRQRPSAGNGLRSGWKSWLMPPAAPRSRLKGHKLLRRRPKNVHPVRQATQQMAGGLVRFWPFCFGKQMSWLPTTSSFTLRDVCQRPLPDPTAIKRPTIRSAANLFIRRLTPAPGGGP